MQRKYSWIFLLIVAILTLTGCSSSIQKEQKAAKETAQEIFKGKVKDTNKESHNIEFYVPFGVTITEEQPNNVILKKGSQTYILFYNQNEAMNSEVVYKSSIIKNEAYRLNSTFQDDGRFGFIFIKDLKDNLYELTVGIGGVKMTTESKAKDIDKNTQLMMEIVASSKIKE